MGGNVDLTDRRLRRQIANCNERRRMQSINAGFQSLKLLLPRRDGEKLSKVSSFQKSRGEIYVCSECPYDLKCGTWLQSGQVL